MTEPRTSPSSVASPSAVSPAALPGWPVLRLGFRPFYLLSALLACVSVPLWIAVFLGYMPWALPMPALLWHGHEMLFGFAGTVVAGFLLTAVRAWTGLDTPRGGVLGALVLLWLAARLAAVLAPYSVFFVLDIVLLPAVALLLMRVLLQANNKRNMPLMGLLLLMAAANAVFHLCTMRGQEAGALHALYAQLGLVLVVVTLITGRVVPLFTKNVTPGLVIASSRPLELAVLASTALTMLLWVFAAPGVVVAVFSAAAALLHALRLYRWSPWVTLKRPILWVLHLSYAWMALGFALLAAAALGLVAQSFALHALAIGVVGGLIIGMMTRTARGHTGRPLTASRTEALAYALVLLAAVVRVLLPIALPAAYVRALEISATLWALGFALYLWVYTPWLLRSRLDGKDG